MHDSSYNIKIFCKNHFLISYWQNPKLSLWQITDNLDEFYNQPFKIALLDIFDEERDIRDLDLSKVDLFLAYDRWCHAADIYKAWVHKYRIKNFLLMHQNSTYSTNYAIYRPEWFAKLDFKGVISPEEFDNLYSIKEKPYLFDVLLGSPRFHRSYVMLCFLDNPELEKKSLISYKREFLEDPQDTPDTLNSKIEQLKSNLKNDVRLSKLSIYKNIDNVFPYESPDLYKFDTNFTLLDARQGMLFPYQIYSSTWYSVVTETAMNSFITLTEKLARPIFAKRIFVLFGTCGSLKLLRSLGFKTFSDIIDESYDNIEHPYIRFSLAFKQIKKLSELDPVEVYTQMKDIIEFNYNRLHEYINETAIIAHDRLLSKIPIKYR